MTTAKFLELWTPILFVTVTLMRLVGGIVCFLGNPSHPGSCRDQREDVACEWSPSGLQQAVPAAGVARGDAGPERGAPLLGDAEPAGRHSGGRVTQDGDAAGRRRILDEFLSFD